MNTRDRAVAALLDALDKIQIESLRVDGRLPYINGLASQAIKMCHAHMTRNSDGYLVIPDSPVMCSNCDAPLKHREQRAGYTLCEHCQREREACAAYVESFGEEP